MSIGDRVMSGLKDLLTIRDEVDEIKAAVRANGADVRDHESRLVRLETLVEVAAGRPAKPRLPRR